MSKTKNEDKDYDKDLLDLAEKLSTPKSRPTKKRASDPNQEQDSTDTIAPPPFSLSKVKEIMEKALEKVGDVPEKEEKIAKAMGVIRLKYDFDKEAADHLDRSHLIKFDWEKRTEVPEDVIKTVAELCQHLKTAMQLELATIPLYLYGMYSIKDPFKEIPDPKQELNGLTYFDAIRSVAVEEMLHLALVCNIVSATVPKVMKSQDGFQFYCKPFKDMKKQDPKKRINRSLLPLYPLVMPHRSPELTLNLAPATRGQIALAYMEIERPEGMNPGAFEEQTKGKFTFKTIGQFYEAIKKGFQKLDKDLTLPDGGYNSSKDTFTAKQVYPGSSKLNSGYYPVKGIPHEEKKPWKPQYGNLKRIENLDTVLETLEFIIEQGEGKPGEDPKVHNTEELAHYFKFKAMLNGDNSVLVSDNKDGILYNLATNPKTKDFPKKVQALSNLFNGTYCFSLRILDAIMAGEPEGPVDEQGNVINDMGHLNQLYNDMNLMMAPLGRLLVTQPGKEGYLASPTFEYISIPHPTKTDRTLPDSAYLDKIAKGLLKLCDDAITAYSEDTKILRTLHRVWDAIARSLKEAPEKHAPIPNDLTFNKDIRSIINARDYNEMMGEGEKRDLRNFEVWKNHGDAIYRALGPDGNTRGGPMPDGGPNFSKRELDIIKKWLAGDRKEK